MPSILVTPVPVNVVTELPDTPFLVARCQNIDPTETVYRLVSDTSPDPSGPGFQHPPGDRWTMRINEDYPSWLWVSKDTALVMVESVPGW